MRLVYEARREPRDILNKRTWHNGAVDTLRTLVWLTWHDVTRGSKTTSRTVVARSYATWYSDRTRIYGRDSIVNETAVGRSGRFQRQRDLRGRGLNQRYAHFSSNFYIWVTILCIHAGVGTRHICNSIQRRKLYFRVGIGRLQYSL